MKERAVLYARVSDDDRPTEGRNLAGQLDMCREYSLENDWAIVAELSENVSGASGYKLHLPELGKLMAMAENGVFDILVVREMDRLSRRLVKQILIEDSLNQSGIRIEYVLGDYPDTPDGNLLKNIRAVISEYEREKILERFRRGLRLSIKSGNVTVFGYSPYGYKKVEVDGKRNLRIVEREAKIVRLIFNWYSNGAGKPLSTIQIARKLNAMGVPTPSQSKGYKPEKQSVSHQWNSAAVNNVLRKETYIGIWRWGKSHITEDGRYIRTDPSTHLTIKVPAIVDTDVWDAVQRRKVNNKSKKEADRKNFLLYGRLICVGCGGRFSPFTMTSSTGKPLRYYHCYKAIKYDGSCYNSRLFPAEWLDDAVFNWVRNLICSYIEEGTCITDQVLEGTARRGTPLIDTEKVKLSHERCMRDSFNLYLSGELSIDEIDERQRELDDKMENLKKINAAYLSGQNEAAENIYNVITSLLPPDSLEQLLINEEIDRDTEQTIIESTNIRGRLNLLDGQLIADIRCQFGNKTFSRKTLR